MVPGATVEMRRHVLTAGERLDPAASPWWLAGLASLLLPASRVRLGSPSTRPRHLLVVAALWLAGCSRGVDTTLPPPAADPLRQADAASEIVDMMLLARHDAALLGSDPPGYLREQLRRLGLAPGGRRGSWLQPFETRRRVVVSGSPWVLRRDDARLELVPGRDLVAALGGGWGGVRLRGLQAVFVAPTLEAVGRSLASRVLVVLDPRGAPGATEGSALADLFRRAAAVRADAVLLLPRPGLPPAIPTPIEAADLTAGSGLPVAAWLEEAAARDLVRTFLGTTEEALPRLERRGDLPPLVLGTLDGEVTGEVQREPHRNLVAVLSGREGGDEAVAVVAVVPLPPSGGGGSTEVAAPARVGAAAELLAVATAFQALPDPPRRTVVFALVDPADDGTVGARHLMDDPRWAGPRLAAALVLAGGTLRGPTEDITLAGVPASPLHRLAVQVAARQGRRAVAAAAPRGPLTRSPAWAFLAAGVPTALVEPGNVPRALAVAEPGVAEPAPTPLGGMVEDARLVFRLALELAEGERLPPVDAVRVQALLRETEPTPTPPPPSRRLALPPPRTLLLPATTPLPAAVTPTLPPR